MSFVRNHLIPILAAQQMMTPPPRNRPLRPNPNLAPEKQIAWYEARCAKLERTIATVAASRREWRSVAHNLQNRLVPILREKADLEEKYASELVSGKLRRTFLQLICGMAMDKYRLDPTTRVGAGRRRDPVTTNIREALGTKKIPISPKTVRTHIDEASAAYVSGALKAGSRKKGRGRRKEASK